MFSVYNHRENDNKYAIDGIHKSDDTDNNQNDEYVDDDDDDYIHSVLMGTSQSHPDRYRYQIPLFQNHVLISLPTSTTARLGELTVKIRFTYDFTEHNQYLRNMNNIHTIQQPMEMWFFCNLTIWNDIFINLLTPYTATFTSCQRQHWGGELINLIYKSPQHVLQKLLDCIPNNVTLTTTIQGRDNDHNKEQNAINNKLQLLKTTLKNYIKSKPFPDFLKYNYNNIYGNINVEMSDDDNLDNHESSDLFTNINDTLRPLNNGFPTTTHSHQPKPHIMELINCNDIHCSSDANSSDTDEGDDMWDPMMMATPRQMT